MIVLDSSVIIEYIDLKGKLHDVAEVIFENLNQGKLTGLIPHPTLTETYYVAQRIYKKIEPKNAKKKATLLINWLYSHPHLRVIADTLNLAILAGEIKLKLHLALTDCYVLATSKIHNAKAVFKKREREMQDVIREIEENFDIIFLEDYKE